ncbi:MAG: phosphoribosylformylglycinamidine synthase subunit PurL [Acidimicrobiia bacterium]
MTSLHRQLGLTDDEFARIEDIIGRTPTHCELAMFSVMWSEHCSYKSSKVHLKRLPTEAPWVLVGPGEGAGVVDVGDGEAIAIRIESHNHPSAVEPYQGAATGVGGIIRDIFSMGARPIALMDPLRFGPLTDARTRYLFEGVVSGISGYGNAVGVPTVGGEVVFDPCYAGNPLVNVLCIGQLPQDRLVLARAEGVGNLAVLLGASTGRDGIGGASVLASQSFTDGDEEKRPSVQVGDPFEEKKLIEACLALLEAGLAVGVQDLGAAGICCATSETAAKTGAGMDVDLARIHRREPGMEPWEVMISESQERMLAIVTPENLDEVLALAAKWEITANVIGRVTDSGRFRVFDGLFDAAGVPGANPTRARGAATAATEVLFTEHNMPCVADVPIESLGDGPVYERPLARPAALDALQAEDPWNALHAQYPEGADLGPELLALLATPTIADKSWVFRQYDHQLFLNTVAGPGSDAAVLRLKGTTRALAVSTDGKGRFCGLDPRSGAVLAVLEAARNIACAGARPLALVNNLNFGNPEHPEVMWQFSEVIDGIGEACRALEIPVVGGNVSFYNESNGRDIDPTPVMGVLGLIDDLTTPPAPSALAAGQTIVLLGESAAELAGSEWAATVHGLRGGMPPSPDLKRARALHALVASLVTSRAVVGVHDCSDGGLAVALTEMAIAGNIGYSVTGEPGLAAAAACFGESASRVVVAVETARVDAVQVAAQRAGVPATVLGTTGGEQCEWLGAYSVPLDAAAHAWRMAIPDALGARI